MLFSQIFMRANKMLIERIKRGLHMLDNIQARREYTRICL